MTKETAGDKNRRYYPGKRVFVTGHTGFKGAWLTAILHELGAETTGYALPPESGCLFERMNGERWIHHIAGDIRTAEQVERALMEARPELVFHLAAQVPAKQCFENPSYTYETNVMGTVNLLEAIRRCPSVKSVVIVTTDKVYLKIGRASCRERVFQRV